MLGVFIIQVVLVVHNSSVGDTVRLPAHSAGSRVLVLFLCREAVLEADDAVEGAGELGVKAEVAGSDELELVAGLGVGEGGSEGRIRLHNRSQPRGLSVM